MNLIKFAFGLPLVAVSSFAFAVTIENSGFESGLSGWTEVEPAYSSSDAYSGSGSLKITGSPARVSQSVSVAANTDYVLSAWVKGDGQILINSGSTGPGFKNNKFSTSSWTQVSVSFNSGDATSVEVGAKYTSDTVVTRFDDFSLTSSSSSSSSSSLAREPDCDVDILSGSSAISKIKSLFDVEGDDPYGSNNTMTFDALNSRYVTTNGGGWRHEAKIASDNRTPMSETCEYFSADIKVDLSDSIKTIISQFHASSTATHMKIYLSDIRESGRTDATSSNGVFDLYARFSTPGSSSETVFDLGTVESGDTFHLTIINDHANLYVAATGQKDEDGNVVSSDKYIDIEVDDSDASYFKFGDYMQAQDPDTLEKYKDSSDWAAFFSSVGITDSNLTFSNIMYGRNDD